MKRGLYTIPRMDKCINSLGEAIIFSILGANNGNLQIKINAPDRDKTAFVYHGGLYRFERMPFGLQNALSTFQRTIDVILFTVRRQFALVYLDDIMVFSKAPEEHITHSNTCAPSSTTQKLNLSLGSASSSRT